MQSIARVRTAKPVMTVDEAVAADRKYFDEHPDEDEYIREFVPGEFGADELPESHASVLTKVANGFGRGCNENDSGGEWLQNGSL